MRLFGQSHRAAPVCVVVALSMAGVGGAAPTDSATGEAALHQLSVMAKVLTVRLENALGPDLVGDNLFQAGGVRAFRIPHLIRSKEDPWLGVVFLANVTFPLAAEKPSSSRQPAPRKNSLWDAIERGNRGPWESVRVTDEDWRKTQILQQVVLSTFEEYGRRLTAIGPGEDVVVLVGCSGRDAVGVTPAALKEALKSGNVQGSPVYTPGTWWSLRAKKRDLVAGGEALRERAEIRASSMASREDAEIARETAALARILEVELDDKLRGEVCTASMIHRGIEGFSVPSVGTFYSIEVRFPVARPWWTVLTPTEKPISSALREAERNKEKIERLKETIFDVLSDYARLAARRTAESSRRRKSNGGLSSHDDIAPSSDSGAPRSGFRRSRDAVSKAADESLAEYLERRLGSAGERREAEPCRENLRKISLALVGYRRDHNGEMPPELADLCPAYLPDESILGWSSHDSSRYYYEFSRRQGGDEFKLQQAEEYGDKVPVVSCLHHPRGRLALSYGGEIYLSEHFGENVFPTGRTLNDKDARVRQVLLEIGAALAKYREDRGEWPNELKALCPIYLKDASLFVCPVTSKPLSYEFAAEKRERNLQLLEALGGYVPIVRAPGVLENGRVLNLACSGEIYESDEEWEDFVRQIVAEQPRPEDRIIIVVTGRGAGRFGSGSRAKAARMEDYGEREAQEPPEPAQLLGAAPLALGHRTVLVIGVDMSTAPYWKDPEDVARLATVEAYAY